MNLTSSGSSKWDALAQQQFHKQVAIVLDGHGAVGAGRSSPTRQAFSSFGGTAEISGNFTQDEADEPGQAHQASARCRSRSSR